MTASELKSKVEAAGSLFFHAHNMRRHGDTMRNYGVRDVGDCWELWRKRPVKNGKFMSAYFDKDTFRMRYK